ncbi:MAG TPA: nucleotide exchange factor GrpE [Thermomicrobiales bacterium]|nr:nucleotide exchange factor GrpE [Thermomicrobiales bacterium]
MDESVVIDDMQRPTTTTTNGHENDDGAQQPSPDELLSELEQLKADAAEMLDSLQRARAEFANYRRRIEAEQTRLRERATEQLLSRLLPVVDDFDRALRSVPEEIASNGWFEGIRLVERKLWHAVESEGVSVMESVGQPFDPSRHEAIMVDEGADAADTVVEEFQRGYMINDRVIRPAMVKVGAAAAPGAQNEHQPA